MNEVADLAEYAAQQAAYLQAVRDAVEELEWMSGTLVATALGLHELGAKLTIEVGTVVTDPQHVLASSSDVRVQRILALSAALLAAAEAISTSGG